MRHGVLTITLLLVPPRGDGPRGMLLLLILAGKTNIISNMSIHILLVSFVTWSAALDIYGVLQS